jgi:phosphoglycolate phosphatase/pyrophosphatase PpaX
MSQPVTAPTAAAILFDLDGTLIDTKSLYIEAYRQAVQPYVREELTPDDIKALRPTSELAFLRAVVHDRDFDACLADFYRAYEALHVDRFAGVYPGVPGTLTALRDAGIPMGLVTGKSRRSWEITRAVIELPVSFGALVFDDDVRAPKPDPHGLELAVEAMGVDPGEALYVGDTLTDMEAARAAGLRPIAALWAFGDGRREEHLERIRGVDATPIRRPEELLALVGVPAR